MSDLEPQQDAESGTSPGDFERAQTNAADVESAGRSCIIIIALGIVILALLAVWIVYTSS